MKKQYCLGFCFNEARDSVVLIRKTRPEWQNGLLNGVGGHVETNESISESMPREFWEETGVQTHERGWSLYCKLSGEQAEVFCFRLFSSKAHDESETRGDEFVIKVPISDLAKMDVIPNLLWLIPLALDNSQPITPRMTTVES